MYRKYQKTGILVDIAINPLKSIRKGKSVCVSENLAFMLQGRHQTFQISGEMANKNELEVGNPPLKMEQIKCSEFFTQFPRGLPTSSFFFFAISPLILKGFRNTPTFFLSDGFQSS